MSSFAMNDTTIETKLDPEFGPISWVGYAVGGVDAEFAPILVETSQ